MAMEFPSISLYSLSLWGGAAALALLVYFRKASSSLYPPGPKGLPILGNALQIPSTFQWLAFDKWCKELGSDIIYLTAAGNKFLVLGSMEVVDDLCEKRSSVYSSRPRFPMLTELMGWDWLFAAMEYGEPWRERRRLFTQYFHPSEPAVYRPHGMHFVRGMLPKLLERPGDFFGIARHAVGGSALSMAYGFPIKKENDPYIDLSERALASISTALLPGNFLINVFPVLKYVPAWVPGAGFQKMAKEWKKLQVEFREVPYEKSVLDMADGLAKPSYTTNSLSNLQQFKEEEREHQIDLIKDTAGMVFEAASETTLAAILVFFAGMLQFPDVQKKAQEELDQVLNGRLPEYSDEVDTPYVSALVKEVLRWKPILPLGVPRTLTEDDVYRGYHLTKDTFVMVNAWSLLQDEKHYPNPDILDPERFLRNGKLRTDIREPADIIFGFSRRICPGNHIALSFLWLTISSILSVYNISSAIDDDGKEIKQEIKYRSGAVCEPYPFKCTIRPRSSSAEVLIGSVETESDVGY